MPEPEFDVLSSESADADDYIDFFNVPYYTNGLQYDDVERHYQWMKGVDERNTDEFYLVLWANREKPTLEEAQAKMKELLGDDLDDDEGEDA